MGAGNICANYYLRMIIKELVVADRKLKSQNMHQEIEKNHERL